MPRRITHDRRVLLLILSSGLPSLITGLVLLWHRRTDTTPNTDPGVGVDTLPWILSLFLITWWLAFAFAARERVIRPLQTIANLLSALGEGDFSIRARGARRGDALGEALIEVNALSRTLRDQRLGALEASALLHTVMEEINLAVFTFDDHQKLRLVNRAGERLLVQPAERLLGRTATDLGLADCLTGDTARTFQATFPGAMGRWGMRRSTFRQGGLPHQLIVLADLSKALREEERLAWQRLLRVLGHEINNSLAPIKSISASLANLLSRPTLPDDWREDARSGLTVVGSRAEALSRFMAAYSQLARLPAPRLAPVDVNALVHRVAALETRLQTRIQPGPSITLDADGDQLEQLLINILRNATDAALETRGTTLIAWNQRANELEIRIEDDGPGLSNTANLFVPFFTTKPGGSGIGLALSRQIAEAHNGSLTLQNHPQHHGCVACLRLPLSSHP